MKAEYEASPGNSHPSEDFARTVAPLFCQRIVDVVEGRGDSGSLTGVTTAVAGKTWGEIKGGR